MTSNKKFLFITLVSAYTMYTCAVDNIRAVIVF